MFEFDIDDDYIRDASLAYLAEIDEMKQGTHSSQVKDRIEKCLVSRHGDDFGEITFLDWDLDGARVRVHVNHTFYGVFDCIKNKFEEK